MKRRLLWDAGQGEIRTGLIENDILTEVRLIRLRRGEKALIATGENYTARITARLPGGSALVSLGSGDEALLEYAGKHSEGQLLSVEMVRGPIPEPGRWKRAKVRALEGGTPAKEPCWHPAGEPWERALDRAAQEGLEIVCGSAAVANEVEAFVGKRTPISIDPQAIDDADFETLLSQAQGSEFAIAGGAISLERTRAMTIIDVDGVGDSLTLNINAAQEGARLLKLYDIGGPIGIDFVSMKSKADRSLVDKMLADSCQSLGPHERTAINGFGFAQIIRPRFGPSVPELMCGTTPGRLTTETRAIMLLRAAGRSIGHGARTLTASPAIIDLIRSWPEETAALRFSLGVAIELVPDSGASGYGHVHVDQS